MIREATARPRSETRIFGMRLAVDPKLLVGVLVLLAIVLFWYNSHGDEETAAPSASVRAPGVAPAPTALPRTRTVIRRSAPNDRAALRIRSVDATRGDIDPTLRLDLLVRLQRVEPGAGGRSLFDSAAAAPQQMAGNLGGPMHGPAIVPRPLPPPSVQQPLPSGPPPLNIPLKFYGFVRPTDKREGSRGFFMDGDNVLVATEGEVLKQRYLVVEMNAKSARLEDIQLKQGETLPVEPEATAQP